MVSNNKAGKNLNELLKAGGYDDAEGTDSAGHLGELSRPIQHRVRALKKYQMESLQIESQFYQRVHDLEKEFQPLFDAVNAKRKAVVVGEIEPDEPDTELPPLLHGVASEELEKLEREAPVEGGEPSKGIPGFWFRALNSVGQISDTIKEYDEPILKYLVDITSEVHTDPAGFSLHFHFTDNPYFSNSVLTKYYEMDINVDQQKPFEYDGPNIINCKGTEIKWKEGKNVTQKTVKKKQKKGPHAGKYVTKTVSSESFFNFFDSSLKIINDDVEDTEQQKIQEEVEIGQVIRDQVVPRAVLFFTGEAAEDEDWDDFDDEEEEEEGDGASGTDEE